MDSEYVDLLIRCDEIWQLIRNLQPGRARLDATKMHKNVESNLSLMGKELVECKRRQSISQKYLTLKQQTVEMLDHIEQYITLGILISP